MSVPRKNITVHKYHSRSHVEPEIIEVEDALVVVGCFACWQHPGHKDTVCTAFSEHGNWVVGVDIPKYCVDEIIEALSLSML